MLDKFRSFIEAVTHLRYYQFAKKIERPDYTKRPKHLSIQEQLNDEGYYSQSGQDKWIIEKFFPRKEFGTFVDIGANDGISLSNTYLLEQRGWKGIAVEPNPYIYEKLVKNRKCITVQGCIASIPGIKRFRVISGYSEMLSGLVDEYDPRHIKRIETEIESKGGEFKDIEVYCYNLVDLLKNHGFSQVDYLSIDVEGAEYNILRSIDFNRIHISVIGVENAYRDWRIPQLLVSKGFVFHSIVGDEFYQNRKII